MGKTLSGKLSCPCDRSCSVLLLLTLTSSVCYFQSEASTHSKNLSIETDKSEQTVQTQIGPLLKHTTKSLLKQTCTARRVRCMIYLISMTNASMTFRRNPFRRRDNSSIMTILRCDISSNTTFGRNKKLSMTFGRNCHN